MYTFYSTWHNLCIKYDTKLTLRKDGVTPEIRKCEFFTDRIKYLCHIILPGILEIEEAAARFLHNLEHTFTTRELRSFLGLCNNYSLFARNYYDLAAQLYQILKENLLTKHFPLFT